MLEITKHVGYSQDYHLKNVRALLLDTFTATELKHFIEVNSEFQRVARQLLQDASLSQIVHEILEYAERQVKVPTLLALVKDRSLDKYEAHRPYYASVGVLATITAKGSDKELQELQTQVAQASFQQKISEGLALFVQTLNIPEGLNYKTQQKFNLVELISKEKAADLSFSVTVTGAEDLLQEFSRQLVEESVQQKASNSLEPLAQAMQEAGKASIFFSKLGLSKLL